jgi:uncharacterized protein (DUF488 family)
MAALFTIGYSGLDTTRFVELLRASDVDVVCDVRSTPYSTYKPDFSRGTFREFLNRAGIKYTFMGDQLGARPKDRSCYVAGQATYERIAEAQFFRTGLDRLRTGVKKLNLALVCSERDPIECHRAVLVCRHLPELRSIIHHIHTEGSVEAQEQFEERLVLHHGTAPPPLLQRPGDWEQAVRLAYGKQGDVIAYRERGFDEK